MCNLHWCHRIHNSGDKGWACLFLIDCNCNQIFFFKKKRLKTNSNGNFNMEKIDGTGMKIVTFNNINWLNLNITIFSGGINQLLTFSFVLYWSTLSEAIIFSSPWTALKSSYLGIGEDERAGAVRSHAHQLNGKREICDWLWILLQAVKCA